MATTKPKDVVEKSGTPPPPAPKILQNVDFGALMDQIGTGDSAVLYLAARTKLRLLPLLEGREPVFPVTTNYQGKARTKYLMGVWNLSPSTGKGEGNSDRKVFAVLLSKRTVRNILQFASEGWDFFNPETGRGLVMVKTGQGLNTEISIAPSPNAIPIPEEVLQEWYDFDMAKVAEEWSRAQANRAATSVNGASDHDADDEEEEAPPKRKGKNTARDEGGW